MISSRISGWRVIASIDLAEDDADADAGADGAEATAHAEADRLAGLGGFFGCGRQKGDQSYVHDYWLL